jgi:putative flippase GtrA
MYPQDDTEREEGTTAAARLAHRLHLPTTFVKFVIVGGMGFVIFQFFLFLVYDAPVFWFLPSQDTSTDFGLFTLSDIRLFIASVVAVEIAIICQFNLHDRWTFRWRPRDGWIGQRFIKFQVSSIMSPIIVVVTVNALTPILRDAVDDESFIGTLAPYLSSALGVLMGFIWNWTLNSLIIWPHQRKADDERQAA